MEFRKSIVGHMFRIAAATAAILFAPTIALSQFSANIDINAPVPPPLGGGVPSSDFGAAAGDSGRGFWNKINFSMSGPVTLRGLDGNLTSVVMSGPNGGGGGGYNFPGQDDNRALMNDGRDIGTSDAWTFEGVPTGLYAVRTYAVIPSFENSFNPTAVTVTGAGTKYVIGPILVDEFVEGQTHVTHSIRVGNGTFSIRVERGQFYSGFVNGFQITAIVPEPASLAAVVIGFLSLRLRKRKRRS